VWEGRTGEGGNGELARKPSQGATLATTAFGETVVLLAHTSFVGRPYAVLKVTQQHSVRKELLTRAACTESQHRPIP